MSNQLISYIAPGAPATRRPAAGNEPFLRPEIGFTPKWYYDGLGVEFGEQWHIDPSYRQETIVGMQNELQRRFPGHGIGDIGSNQSSIDLLTGTFGGCVIAGIYGVPIIYKSDQWPVCEKQYLSSNEIDDLEPPDLDCNPMFQNILKQVEWIAQREYHVLGFINWQGVLNNAHRIRGEQLFIDMLENPERAHHLFACITVTMIDAIKRLQERQRKSGVDVSFITVSNCLVNMVSADIYRSVLLPYDQRLANAFGCIGIHNCAWNANAYIDDYANIPFVAYIDMGADTDLRRVRELFPKTRRAIMYTPMDVANKSLDDLRKDLYQIARECGPCDVVAADIESGTPDQRVIDFIEMCQQISAEFEQINGKNG